MRSYFGLAGAVVAISFGSTLPAMALSDSELKEMTAFIINSNGMLCAEVTDIRPLQLDGEFEVTCIEHRGGTGTKRYIMNAKEGTAFEE